MFNMNTESKLSGAGYLILNVLRVLNIIVLLLVAIASWVMLVMTVKTSSFFFFDGVSHFITSTCALFLIASEVPFRWLKTYFAETWPVLSVEYGLTYLGMAMIALGFNILGNLNKEATNVEHLGLPLWRVVIAAGILASIIGFFNIIATFIFSDSKRNLTGRHVRSYGAAPPPIKLEKSMSLNSGHSSHRMPSTRRAPSPSLPSYTNAAADPPRTNRMSQFKFKFPIRTSHISKPILNDPEQVSAKWNERSSPVIPDVQRPPTALHPYHNTGPTYPASSRYSEVSNITRF